MPRKKKAYDRSNVISYVSTHMDKLQYKAVKMTDGDLLITLLYDSPGDDYCVLFGPQKLVTYTSMSMNETGVAEPESVMTSLNLIPWIPMSRDLFVVIPKVSVMTQVDLSVEGISTFNETLVNQTENELSFNEKVPGDTQENTRRPNETWSAEMQQSFMHRRKFLDN